MSVNGGIIKMRVDPCQKYELSFSFYMSKSINDLLYGVVGSVGRIQTLDSLIYSEASQLMRRIYKHKTLDDRDEISDRLQCLTQLFSGPQQRTISPMMFMTGTQYIFERREFRLQKFLQEQGSSDDTLTSHEDEDEFRTPGKLDVSEQHEPQYFLAALTNQDQWNELSPAKRLCSSEDMSNDSSYDPEAHNIFGITANQFQASKLPIVPKVNLLDNKQNLELDFEEIDPTLVGKMQAQARVTHKLTLNPEVMAAIIKPTIIMFSSVDSTIPLAQNNGDVNRMSERNKQSQYLVTEQNTKSQKSEKPKSQPRLDNRHGKPVVSLRKDPLILPYNNREPRNNHHVEKIEQEKYGRPRLISTMQQGTGIGYLGHQLADWPQQQARPAEQPNRLTNSKRKLIDGTNRYQQSDSPHSDSSPYNGHDYSPSESTLMANQQILGSNCFQAVLQEPDDQQYYPASRPVSKPQSYIPPVQSLEGTSSLPIMTSAGATSQPSLIGHGRHPTIVKDSMSFGWTVGNETVPPNAGYQMYHPPMDQQSHITRNQGHLGYMGINGMSHLPPSPPPPSPSPRGHPNGPFNREVYLPYANYPYGYMYPYHVPMYYYPYQYGRWQQYQHQEAYRMDGPTASVNGQQPDRYNSSQAGEKQKGRARENAQGKQTNVDRVNDKLREDGERRRLSSQRNEGELRSDKPSEQYRSSSTSRSPHRDDNAESKANHIYKISLKQMQNSQNENDKPSRGNQQYIKNCRQSNITEQSQEKNLESESGIYRNPFSSHRQANEVQYDQGYQYPMTDRPKGTNRSQMKEISQPHGSSIGKYGHSAYPYSHILQNYQYSNESQTNPPNLIKQYDKYPQKPSLYPQASSQFLQAPSQYPYLSPNHSNPYLHPGNRPMTDRKGYKGYNNYNHHIDGQLARTVKLMNRGRILPEDGLSDQGYYEQHQNHQHQMKVAYEVRNVKEPQRVSNEHPQKIIQLVNPQTYFHPYPKQVQNYQSMYSQPFNQDKNRRLSAAWQPQSGMSRPIRAPNVHNVVQNYKNDNNQPVRTYQQPYMGREAQRLYETERQSQQGQSQGQSMHNRQHPYRNLRQQQLQMAEYYRNQKKHDSQIGDRHYPTAQECNRIRQKAVALLRSDR